MKKIIFTLVMLVATLQAADAQVAALPYTPSLGVFTPISGTTVDSPGADDIYYNNIPIGFTFQLAGVGYNTVCISTNGFIVMDTSSLIVSGWNNILSGNINNIIAPLAADLRNSLPNASLQYATIGTAPNRMFVTEWQHYSYFGFPNGDLSLQCRLHEGSGCIEFVYGNMLLSNSPLPTQIGIRGSNSSDFIALGDTVCNWANAYPYPAVNTYFPISTSCSMPSGFTFNFGPCIEGSGVGLSFLTGKAFNDLNGNASFDIGEPPLAAQIIHLLPGNYYVATDGNGDYTFFYTNAATTYTLQTNDITYWQSTTGTSLSCQPASQATSNLNFGFQMIPGIHDLAVQAPNVTARPGFQTHIPVSYQNYGTATESDTLTFVMDPMFSFVSATPTPTSVNGQTLSWAFSNFQPGDQGSIVLNVLTDLSAVMGSTLHSYLHIGPLNDTLPANNTDSLNHLVVNSFDPNDKLADPAGMIESGTRIHYTIRFQNTGNAVAYNVQIADTLSSSLDLQTLQLEGASHNMNFTLDGNNTAHFTFYNIMLPDSGTNQAASNGFVSFSLQTKNGLSPLTVIPNRASIYFDFNPPIFTNVVTDTIQMVTSAGMLQASNSSLYPNPVKDFVYLQISENSGSAKLFIYSAQGQLVKSIIVNQGLSQIYTGDLAKGLYTIECQNGEETIRNKFVKN